MLRSRRLCCLGFATLGFMFFSAAPSFAFEKDLSRLKALANTKVVSLSKKAEDPFTTAAAIHVITREDIRRSGATNIADILRMAPGLQVTQSGSERWEVSSRGFHDTTQNKLLILIDGRISQSPLFPGVRWDAQDTIIEDIKQVEVIRGPGGAVWGSNAVNGVINIITEDAINTLEKSVNFIYGTNETIASGRVGGKLQDNAHYRVYTKYLKRNPLHSIATDDDAHDEWDKYQGGFRVDWDKDAQNAITFQGDMHKGHIDRQPTLPLINAPFSQTLYDDSDIVGGNLMGKWEYRSANNSGFSLQGYINHFQRNFDVSKERVTSYDVDFQHYFNLTPIHEITWGTGYRLSQQRLPERTYFLYTPTDRTDNLFTAFLQDKISIVPNTLFFTIGSKFEKNDYTDYEYQPSARLAWTPSSSQTIWGAVSRTTRIPSRAEHDIQQITGVVKNSGFIALIGNEQFKSEEQVSYEIGYKVRPHQQLLLDTTAFYNDYDSVRTFETGTAFSNITVPLDVSNYGTAETYGFETAITWDAKKNWQLSGSYSFLTMDTHVNPGSTGASSLDLDEKRTARNRFSLTSHMSFHHDIEFDNSLYYTDNITTANIPAYFRLDSRVAWKPKDNLELSIVGQNLLDDYHQEFNPIGILEAAEVGRSVYGKVSVRF